MGAATPSVVKRPLIARSTAAARLSIVPASFHLVSTGPAALSKKLEQLPTPNRRSSTHNHPGILSGETLNSDRRFGLLRWCSARTGFCAVALMVQSRVPEVSFRWMPHTRASERAADAAPAAAEPNSRTCRGSVGVATRVWVAPLRRALEHVQADAWPWVLRTREQGGFLTEPGRSWTRTALGKFWGNGSFNMTITATNAVLTKGADVNTNKLVAKVASTAVVLLIPIVALSTVASAAQTHAAHTKFRRPRSHRGAPSTPWSSRLSGLPGLQQAAPLSSTASLLTAVQPSTASTPPLGRRETRSP